MQNLRKRFPIYSRLLYLYPASYRKEFGEQILQTTADMLDHLPRQSDKFKLWLRLTLDVPFNLGRQQVKYLGEIMSKHQAVNSNMWFRPKRFGVLRIAYQPNSWQGTVVMLPILAAGFVALWAARHYRPEWFTRNPLRLGNGPFSQMPKTWQGWSISIVFVLTLILTTMVIVRRQKTK